MTRKEKIVKMREEMYHAMVSLLGRGYVQEYYESATSEFIQIAEEYIK